MAMEDIKHDKLAVAAIDFGTTYSGFAYCTRHDYEDYLKNKRDQPKIQCPTWKAGGWMNYKAPTCVLFKPNRSFHTFGYDAQSYYQENPDKVDFSQWYYFEHFKMMLYKEKDVLTKDTWLKESIDVNDGDKKMKAVDVFAAVIGYFQGLIMNELLKGHGAKAFSNDDIHWVLTVPAIWDLKAKQFMRDAAEKVNISNDQLTLALEPEAASIHCRRQPVGIQTQTDGKKAIAGMQKGDKYVVFDQGGGTTDITVHEVTGPNSVKEIHQACGGHWGGITVNGEFYKFLVRLLGGDVINAVKENHPVEYYELMHNFEHAKTNFKEDTKKVTVRLPLVWLTKYEEITEDTLKEVIPQTNFNKKIKIVSDKLRIDHSLFRTFFDYSIVNVTDELERLFRKEELSDVQTLLAVGGFSESSVLIDAIKEKLGPEIDVIVPRDPGLAVLKGAVLYGFEPGIITSRVSRYTYEIVSKGPYKSDYVIENGILSICCIELSFDILLFSSTGSKGQIYWTTKPFQMENRKLYKKFCNDDVHWVLTVPAIWDLKAKQFMRDAAEKAGISTDQLSLALEPEAASIHCRKQPVGVEQTGGYKAIASMKEGDKYIVFDQGGGTTDITVHEVTGPNSVKEIHQACGGHWGGITVNGEFYKFLVRLLGGFVINDVKKHHAGAYFELMYSFEHAKTCFNEDTDKTTIRLPVAWLETYENSTNQKLSEVIPQTNFKNQIQLKGDKMRFNHNLFRSFFDYSIINVTDELDKLFKKQELSGVHTLLAVGGFSESPVLIDAVKQKLGEKVNVIVPRDPGLAVLKGAVMFGFEPGTIKSRVSRYTYEKARHRDKAILWKSKLVCACISSTFGQSGTISVSVGFTYNPGGLHSIKPCDGSYIKKRVFGINEAINKNDEADIFHLVSAMVLEETCAATLERGFLTIRCDSDRRFNGVASDKMRVDHGKLIVAAIDFGTTYSGYAYCKHADYTRNPVNPSIQCNPWIGGESLTSKAPTCVLFDTEEKLHSFGHEAIKNYYDNPDKLQLNKYFYFEYFKMMLYEQERNKRIYCRLEHKRARGIKSQRVISLINFSSNPFIIYFIRYTSVERTSMDKTTLPQKQKDVMWVITVPAIWDLRAKQFMRECAKKAKIAHDQIMLALEPEAASIHCRRVPVGVQTEGDGRKIIAAMAPGAQFIVLDQGGGTTDIAIHEVTGENTLKEVHQACGGHWGGITVNKQFYNFLEKIFGNDVINSIKETNPSAFYSLLRNFENKKTSFKKEDEGEPEGQVTLRLPIDWTNTFKAIRSLSLAENVEKTIFHGRVKVNKDKFRIKNDLFRTFYDYSLENVIRELEKLLAKKELKDVQTLLVVGGHSASTVLTEALKTKFPKIGMVIPKDPGLAVLKGAVLFGFDPGTITSRVARFTYGIGTTRAFEKGDPESKKIIVDGVEKCKDVFDKHIEIGQILEVGEDKYLQEHEYVPLYKDQNSVDFIFYDTLNKSPKYVTDDGCRRIGSLHFKLTERMTEKRTMALKINNSGTELVSLVTEIATQKQSKGYFRLPSDSI
ncbi:Hypothetical predicted protein [Mytilus galloprovincialis]|uniref:Heat shock 70 kDa protein 12A n=1 Tax=Mytilus galloprovincialis TaxID=29158 RepID=A0A8B6E7R2_MYTGA|nr:Hypothetical predicted protein [Mytilus galloprovincialis]